MNKDVSMRMFGVEDINSELYAIRKYMDRTSTSAGSVIISILSDIQEMLRDPSGADNEVRTRLNVVKYFIDELIEENQ